MGIRIHRILGYALKDVKSKDYSISDERFNESFLEEWDYIYDIKTDKYQEFLEGELWEKQTTEELVDTLTDPDRYYVSILDKRNANRQFAIKCTLAFLKENPKWSARECISYDAEFGLKNIFCVVQPKEFKINRRYDDSIDYYLETETRKSAAPHVIDISNGIYPLNGLYMFTETGIQLKGVESDTRRFVNNYFQNKPKSKKNLPQWAEARPAMEALTQEHLKMSLDEVFVKTTLLLPEELVIFCQFLNLFKSEKTILQFKPVIYTYWS